MFKNIVDDTEMILSDILDDLDKFSSVLFHTHSGVSNKLLNLISEKSQKISTNIDDGNFSLCISYLSLHFVKNIKETLSNYSKALEENGLFVAIFPCGKTLYELRNAMMEVDLSYNRMVTRGLPMMLSEKLSSLVQACGFKTAVVSTEVFSYQYKDIYELVGFLRKIDQIQQNITPNTPYAGKKYWENVQKIYSKKYLNEATYEIVLCFAVK